MRRLALSVLAACGLAIVSACSGGTGLTLGSGNDSTVPTSVSFLNGSNQVNDFFLAPSGTSPLSVTAVAAKGSGPTAIIVPGAQFTWAARFATAADPSSVNTYLFGPTPSGYKTCGFLPASVGTPAIPILYQAPGSEALSVLQNGQGSSQVFIAPVAGVPAPYCIVLQATAKPGNVIGAVTVVVSNSP